MCDAGGRVGCESRCATDGDAWPTVYTRAKRAAHMPIT